jgi:hypothetical protein
MLQRCRAASVLLAVAAGVTATPLAGQRPAGTPAAVTPSGTWQNETIGNRPLITGQNGIVTSKADPRGRSCAIGF